MNTLLIGDIHPDAKSLLTEKVVVQQINNEEFTTFPSSPDIEAIVLRTFTLCKKKELDKFSHLKYIISCSVGVDNLDLEEIKRRKIELIHVPGTNANSVAEHTLYLILSLLREDRNGSFFELKGKTVGIIGFGAIGKIVAQKLNGFECSVIAFDVIPQDEKILKDLHVTMKTFEEVLQESDVVTVHVPLLPQTRGLLNEKAFLLMKKGCFFVNTSRAEIVYEEALVKNIDKFRGVGLDVYSDWLVRKLEERVLFTPHVAAKGEDSFRMQCVKPVEIFLSKIRKEEE
jgi:D-3-phosphoglycerate dehydrogenase